MTSSSYTILLLFQVQIHSIIIFIIQDLVYFNHITSNTFIFKSIGLYNIKLQLQVAKINKKICCSQKQVYLTVNGMKSKNDKSF